MAVRSTPLWIAGGCYTDVDLRVYFAMLEACPGGGVRLDTGGELAVTAPGGMNVAVAPGSAWVPGSDAAGQGTYLVDNATSTTLAIGANASGNPRIDRIVADVNDPAFTGTGTAVFTLVVVAGTPAGSPSAPATPASAISLATVAVANGAASIVAGNITDTRDFCSGGGAGLMPSGYVALASQGSIVGTEVDLTGLSVSVAGVVGRTYRTTIAGRLNSSVANDVAYLYMRDGSNGAVTQTPFIYNASLGPQRVILEWIDRPVAAGTFVRKGRIARLVGTGTFTITDAYITVEDITGAT